MFLIVVGLVALIYGFMLKPFHSLGQYKRLIMLGGAVVIVIGFATSAIRQIDAGHVGVQKLFGQVQSKVLSPGLNVVNPLVDVIELSVQTQNYTMSSTSSEGQQIGDDAISVLSKDGLQVIIDMTVLYRILGEATPGIIDSIGTNYEEKIIRPQIRSRIREAAVNYVAVDLYSTQRDAFETLITQELDKDFKQRGILLEQLLVRKINLPESVKQSIERKITAEQEAQRMEFVLDKETQEAERKRVEARGTADAQKIVDEGLTTRVLQFEQIKVMKELVNSPNAKIIVTQDGKTPPIILGN